MQYAIYSKIAIDEPITSIKVADVKDTKAAVINELIGLLVIQENIPKAGLKELNLQNWRDIPGSLDNSVLQSLISRCNYLTALTIGDMC